MFSRAIFLLTLFHFLIFPLIFTKLAILEMQLEGRTFDFVPQQYTQQCLLTIFFFDAQTVEIYISLII